MAFEMEGCQYNPKETQQDMSQSPNVPSGMRNAVPRDVQEYATGKRCEKSHRHKRFDTKTVLFHNNTSFFIKNALRAYFHTLFATNTSTRIFKNNVLMPKKAHTAYNILRTSIGTLHASYTIAGIGTDKAGFKFITFHTNLLIDFSPAKLWSLTSTSVWQKKVKIGLFKASLPELCWRHSYCLCKESGKISTIVEAKSKCDFFYR